MAAAGSAGEERSWQEAGEEEAFAVGLVGLIARAAGLYERGCSPHRGWNVWMQGGGLEVYPRGQAPSGMDGSICCPLVVETPSLQR